MLLWRGQLFLQALLSSQAQPLFWLALLSWQGLLFLQVPPSWPVQLSWLLA
jgi:hypothetical protein